MVLRLQLVCVDPYLGLCGAVTLQKETILNALLPREGERKVEKETGKGVGRENLPYFRYIMTMLTNRRNNG